MLVEWAGLEKRFPDRAPLLFGDGAVGDREMVAIVGRSGSGKSTLLHLLSGLAYPSGGVATVLGVRSAADTKNDPLGRLRRDALGIVVQNPQLFRDLTVTQNLSLVQRASVDGASPIEGTARRGALLERLGLAHLAEAYPGTLSGGERQRAALARACANRPRVILADEPTSQLDDERAELVCDLLASEATERSVVVATHDPRVLATASRVVDLAG